MFSRAIAACISVAGSQQLLNWMEVQGKGLDTKSRSGAMISILMRYGEHAPTVVFV